MVSIEVDDEKVPQKAVSSNEKKQAVVSIEQEWIAAKKRYGPTVVSHEEKVLLQEVVPRGVTDNNEEVAVERIDEQEDTIERNTQHHKIIPLVVKSYRIDDASIVNDVPINESKSKSKSESFNDKNTEYAIAYRIVEPSQEVFGIMSNTISPHEHHHEPSIEFYILLILALSIIPSLIAIIMMTTAVTIITSLLPTRNANLWVSAKTKCRE